MISIKSYLKEGNNFIEISSFDSTINSRDNIEGALEVVIWDKPFLTIQMWDYIDQLWSYVIDGLPKVLDNQEFTTFFPDQPIEVKFSPLPNEQLLFSVVCGDEINKIAISKNLLIEHFLHAGLLFFDEMKRLGFNVYPQEMKTLNLVSNRLST